MYSQFYAPLELANLARKLCHLGSNINLIPLAILKELGLDTPSPITMQLVMADQSINRLVGILYDIWLKVNKFILPVIFVILDCEVDVDMPIILGRPFLATGRALMDVERGNLRFKVNEDEVVLNICGTLKSAKYFQVVSVID